MRGYVCALLMRCAVVCAWGRGDPPAPSFGCMGAVRARLWGGVLLRGCPCAPAWLPMCSCVVSRPAPICLLGGGVRGCRAAPPPPRTNPLLVCPMEPASIPAQALSSHASLAASITAYQHTSSSIPAQAHQLRQPAQAWFRMVGRARAL